MSSLACSVPSLPFYDRGRHGMRKGHGRPQPSGHEMAPFGAVADRAHMGLHTHARDTPATLLKTGRLTGHRESTAGPASSVIRAVPLSRSPNAPLRPVTLRRHLAVVLPLSESGRNMACGGRAKGELIHIFPMPVTDIGALRRR